MWSRWFNSSSPEGVRRDICATVVLSVLMVGLGVWGLWEGKIGSGLGSLFGAAVYFWLAYRNYRLGKSRGWFRARHLGQVDDKRMHD